ncbi:MAG TPA: acetyl-CoA decarbonylase/synthase complex subunit gamma, partial [Planctomycetota bacterium]|nr:acetyl-CoA decarbonylase/synthase complex subunit gamma [Planctomycetota bacterium]
MALTGLEIYKHLPKENCKECGLPTCLAFAMKVASGQAGLDDCPRLSDEARAQLSQASAPPQRLVKIGADPHPIVVGQETVMFRHDDKFHHATAVALTISDAGDDDVIRKSCETFGKLQFMRVGETLKADMIALVNDSGSPDRMMTAAEIIYNELGVPMVLIAQSVDSLSAVATGPLSGTRPVLCPKGDLKAEELAELAKQAGAPVVVHGELQAVADKVEALDAAGVKDVLISAGCAPLRETLSFMTRARRAALNKKFRPLGCPALAVALGDDAVAASLDACACVAKYAALVVTNAWEPQLLLPILTARQNIYTDPQKPVQVEPKVYEIGDVTADSPVLVTTNFSLSYYSVESEVEASRVPSYIVAVDT